MRLAKRIIVLVTTVILITACGGKEPPEVLKADLEKDLIGCLVSKNAKPDDEDVPGLADAFSMLGKLANSEIKNKKWSMSSDESSVTAKFSSDTTNFECDFSLDDQGEWNLEKVRRNGEEVFDSATHKAALSVIKERKEAERKKREAEKEAERLKEIATWKERGYANVSYKYYEKRHANSSGGYGETTLKINCKPEEGPNFEFKESDYSMSGKRDVEFKFEQDGQWVSKKFDLTSSGRVGVYKDREYFTTGEIYFDDVKNKEFLTSMKSSSKLEVKGFIFNMDDLSQVPCL